MTLNPSQIINNIKRSFNNYISTAVAPATVNFDQDPFDTASLSSWYAIRYSGISTEPTGMGDLIDESGTGRGRIHVVDCELSAWSGNDPQRASLGSMIDILIAACEAPSITLYDFSDPDNPDECGALALHPTHGTLTPTWGSGRAVWKTSRDAQIGAGVVGFVLELKLTTIAEVD
jgi:hypothetical protein